MRLISLRRPSKRNRRQRTEEQSPSLRFGISRQAARTTTNYKALPRTARTTRNSIGSELKTTWSRVELLNPLLESNAWWMTESVYCRSGKFLLPTRISSLAKNSLYNPMESDKFAPRKQRFSSTGFIHNASVLHWSILVGIVIIRWAA